MIESFSGEYRWLSNFYPSEVWYLSWQYPTVENAYQAAKFSDPKIRARFLTCKPGAAKRLGRKFQVREDWEHVKVVVMRGLIRQKFKVGTELSERLLATGTQSIIEGNTWNEAHWDGEGCRSTLPCPVCGEPIIEPGD